jgi:hypothetical protein
MRPLVVHAKEPKNGERVAAHALVLDADAPSPLVRRLARDPHGLGRRGDRPAIFDQVAQAESTLGGEWRVTVHNEPPWLCGCVDSSTLPRGLTSSGDFPRQQSPDFSRSIPLCVAHGEG